MTLDVAVTEYLCLTLPVDNAMGCAEEKVSGYPVVRYFESGKASEDYEGPRTAERIQRFLHEKVTGEAYVAGEFVNQPVWEENGKVVHLTEDHYDAYVAETPEILVMFYAPW